MPLWSIPTGLFIQEKLDLSLCAFRLPVEVHTALHTIGPDIELPLLNIEGPQLEQSGQSRMVAGEERTGSVLVQQAVGPVFPMRWILAFDVFPNRIW